MKIKRRGLTLNIFEDTYENPREYYENSNIGKMVCWSDKYEIGDKHEFETPKEFYKWSCKHSNQIACILPLFLLDHTNLSISTRPFMDPWDSWQVGYIYCTKEALEQHGYKSVVDDKVIESLLEDEVQEYDKWLSCYPPYYSFEITDEDDNIVESMGIFDGSNFKDMIKEMKIRSENKYDFLFDSLMEREMNCL